MRNLRQFLSYLGRCPIKTVNAISDLVDLTGYTIADTKNLKKVNQYIEDGGRLALIGFNIEEEFENADKLRYVSDLFDADNPFGELEEIIETINNNYAAVVLVSDRRRIAEFKIPVIQLIPEDINVELETVAILDRGRFIDSFRRFLRVNNILDQSLNTLYLSELSMNRPDGPQPVVSLEDVIQASFDFKNIESLEKHRKYNPRNKDTDRFRHYIIEPFPIERYNLISAYRENDKLKSYKKISVRIVNEKDLRSFDFSTRLKQVFLVEENDKEKFRSLNVPEYLDFFVLEDEKNKEEQIFNILEYGKRGYDIVLIEQNHLNNYFITDLIRMLNLYTERFDINFSPNVSFLSKIGVPTNTKVLDINCNTKSRDVLYESVRRAASRGEFISLTNLPEDENFFLIRIWNRIRGYLTYRTPVALFFPETVVITNFGLLSEDINQLYQAHRIVIGNKKAERTRTGKHMVLRD